MKIVDFGYLGINLSSLRQYLISSYKSQPSPESLFLHKGLKNQRAIGYLKIVFFNHPNVYAKKKKRKKTGKKLPKQLFSPLLDYEWLVHLIVIIM